jgi:hypothetical protein
MSRKIKMVEVAFLFVRVAEERATKNAKTHDEDHDLDRVVPETFR